MVLLIDNYDSFTYNLYQYIAETGKEIIVRRNDDFSPSLVKKINPAAIVISPGPGRPSGAGMTEKVVEKFAEKTPILGVCLGHQAIAEVFGARIVRAKHLMHGKTGDVYHCGDALYSGLDSPFKAARYHSLIVSRTGFPRCLEITGWTGENEIMGIRHRDYPVYGVQFHPESVMTACGKKILGNFLKIACSGRKRVERAV